MGMNKQVSGYEYDFNLTPHADESLARCISVFHGRTLAWNRSEGSYKAVAVISGYRLSLASARYSGVPVHSLFTSLSNDMGDFYQWVLQPGLSVGSRHRALADLVVYIDNVSVNASLRRQGIGSDLLKRLKNTLATPDCWLGIKALPFCRNTGRLCGVQCIEGLKRFLEKQGLRHAGADFMVDRPANHKLSEAPFSRLHREDGAQ